MDLEVKHLTPEKIASDRALKWARNGVATFIGNDYDGPEYRMVLEKVK